MEIQFILAVVIGLATCAKGELEGALLNNYMPEFTSINSQNLVNCIETDVHEKALLAGYDFKQCVNPLTKQVNKIMEIVAFGSKSGNLKDDVAEFCRLTTTLKPKCHEDYLEKLNPCLNETDNQALALQRKITEASNKYMCRNKGKYVAAAFTVEEFMCLGSYSMTQHKVCTAPLEEEVRENGGSSLGLPRALLGRGCSLFKDMCNCALKHLNCPQFAQLLQGSFNIISEILTPCPGEVTVEQVSEVAHVESEMLPPESGNKQTEQMKALHNIETLLQDIDGTQKQHLEIEVGMNSRQEKIQKTEEKSYSEIIALIRDILHGKSN